MARQGDVRIPHFAHASSGNECQGGGESSIHKAAKQCLVDASKPDKGRGPRTIKLGLPAYHTRVQEVRLEEWVGARGADRKVDAIVKLDFLRIIKGSSVASSRYVFTHEVAVELMVTHAKELEYGLDMQRVGMPAVEKRVDRDSLYDRVRREGRPLRSVLTGLVLVNVQDCCRWLSIAGLPDEVALNASCYEGSPDYTMGMAEEAIKKGNRDRARDWICFARPVQGRHWTREQAARWQQLEKIIQPVGT